MSNTAQSTEVAPDVSAERKKFEALTARLEASAKANPVAYNRKVAGLAMLGYGYILLVLGVSLALLGALMGMVFFSHRLNGGLLKIGLFLGIFTFAVVKSLFVRMEPPEGMALDRQQAPRLFADIDEIGCKLNAPRPHHVLLTDEFNAAVAQVPRFGILGGQRNYLIVGMQLMSALSPEEFKSVLAHEFGHLSANHSKFSGWIYRVRRTWLNLMEQIGDGWVFGPFFHWYAPYFAAYSFVLARQNEYVADNCAAEICGAPVAAASLSRGAVVGGYLSEDFWPALYNRAGREAEPPRGIYSGLRAALSAPLEARTAQKWLTEATLRPADSFDTHPSLLQRLAHLKQEPHFEPRQGDSAAQWYFGEQLEPLSNQLETQWHQAVADGWKEQHEKMSEARQKLDEIEAKAGAGPLTDEEQWQRADATEDFGDAEVATALYRDYLEAHPDEARAHFAMGRMALKANDAAGLKHFERAIELEHGATLPASQIAESYLLQANRGPEAAVWRERGLEYSDKLEFAETERSSVHPGNIFLPPELSEAEIAKLREHFARFPAVEEVYAARKKVAHFPDVPFFLIAVAMHKKKITISNDEEKRGKALVQALEGFEFEHACTILQLDADANKPFRKPLEKVEGALIYRRAAE